MFENFPANQYLKSQSLSEGTDGLVFILDVSQPGEISIFEKDWKKWAITKMKKEEIKIMLITSIHRNILPKDQNVF